MVGPSLRKSSRLDPTKRRLKLVENLISDPRKPALLNYYSSIENKFSGYPTTFAKEIKYLREHGIKTIYLKDGTSINLDNILLDNLNWTGWKY